MTHLHISPLQSLVDEPLEIAIYGVRTGASVILNARIPSLGMASAAEFVADETGEIHLDRQAPISVSKRGVDLAWIESSELIT